MEKKNVIITIVGIGIMLILFGCLFHVADRTVADVTARYTKLMTGTFKDTLVCKSCTQPMTEIPKDTLVYKSGGTYLTKDGRTMRMGWSTRYGVSENTAMEMDGVIMKVIYETANVQTAIDSLVIKCIKENIVLDVIRVENLNIENSYERF